MCYCGRAGFFILGPHLQIDRVQYQKYVGASLSHDSQNWSRPHLEVELAGLAVFQMFTINFWKLQEIFDAQLLWHESPIRVSHNNIGFALIRESQSESIFPIFAVILQKTHLKPFRTQRITYSTLEKKPSKSHILYNLHRTGEEKSWQTLCGSYILWRVLHAWKVSWKILSWSTRYDA